MFSRLKLGLSVGLLVLMMGINVFADDVYNSPEIIKQVQQALNEQGFDCGTPDGVAGQKTRDAIERFKSSKGLTINSDIDNDLLGGLHLSVTTSEEKEAEDGIIQTYTGSGDYVLTLDSCEDWHFFEIDGNASGRHFAVTSYDSNGNYIDLLVNTTDPYHGRVYDEAQNAGILEIEAEGEWSVKVVSLFNAQTVQRGETVSGYGDDVVFYNKDNGYSQTASISGNASGHHFSIIGYDGNGYYNELYVNTSDPYDGVVLLKDRPRIFVINCEDDWSITFNNDGSDAEEPSNDGESSTASQSSETNSMKYKSLEIPEEQISPSDGYRGYAWGTSYDEIYKNEITGDMVEGRDYAIEEDCIANGYEVAGMVANGQFLFNKEGALRGGFLDFQEKHSDEDQYYEDYKKLVEIYTSVYGDPDKIVEDWKDETYKSDRSNWGHAIAKGDVKFITLWGDINDVYVAIVLEGKNYKADVNVLFANEAYMDK